jgi:hypothetical protein
MAGIQTGYTVVTRESVWDESARARAIALQEHEESVNRFNVPLSEAYKAQPFRVEKVVDYSERAVAAAERAARAAAERANGGTVPDDYGDGVHHYPVIPDPSELRED